MSEQFDLVVIGAGPAGEKGAAQAAYFGHRVAIVDRVATPGGAAVRSAGIPTKTLRETALYVTGFRQRDVYGVGLQLDPHTALQHLRARTEHVVQTMTETVAVNIERHGIDLMHGTARLGPGRSVVVDCADGSTRSTERTRSWWGSPTPPPTTSAHRWRRPRRRPTRSCARSASERRPRSRSSWRGCSTASGT